MPCRPALCAPGDRLDGAVLAGGTIKMHSAAFRDLLSDDCLSARSAGVGCGHRSRRRALRADARLRDVSGLTSEPLPLDGRAGRVPAGLKNPRSLTVTTGQERDPRRGVVLSHRAVRTDLPAITLQVARAELGPQRIGCRVLGEARCPGRAALKSYEGDAKRCGGERSPERRADA